MLRRFFFFFNDTATTEIYTLSLHDALPISERNHRALVSTERDRLHPLCRHRDRKSTRLNSSHHIISDAVFCLQNQRPSAIQHNGRCHPYCALSLLLPCGVCTSSPRLSPPSC